MCFYFILMGGGSLAPSVGLNWWRGIARGVTYQHALWRQELLTFLEALMCVCSRLLQRVSPVHPHYEARLWNAPQSEIAKKIPRACIREKSIRRLVSGILNPSLENTEDLMSYWRINNADKNN